MTNRIASDEWSFPKTDPQTIVNATVDPDIGGHTVDVVTGKTPESGTLVSLPGHEERFDLSAFSTHDLANYTNTPEHFEALTARPTRRLGTWADVDEKGTPTAFVDVSRIYKDSPQGHVRARIAMVAGNQFAGFNTKTFTSEYNPTQPEVLKRAGGNVELDEGEAQRWMTSTAPIGEEVVYGFTTEPQSFSQGRGRKKAVVSANQGTFIFTGAGSQLQPPSK